MSTSTATRVRKRAGKKKLPPLPTVSATPARAEARSGPAAETPRPPVSEQDLERDIIELRDHPEFGRLPGDIRQAAFDLGRWDWGSLDRILTLLKRKLGLDQ